MRVVFLILHVLLGRLRRRLVGGRLHDGADQVIHIEPALDEVLGERVQHVFVRGRIGGAHVVHRFHQPPAHEVAPYAVHEGSREVGIILRRKPLGKILAQVTRGIDRQRRSQQRLRWKRASEPVVSVLARGTGKDADVLKNGSHAGPVARRGAHLQPHTGKEIGHSVVIFLRPLGQRVIVAVRAGDIDAQEGHRDVFRDVRGVAVDHPIIRRAVFPRVAIRIDDLPDELVPGLILRHALPNPAVVTPHTFTRQTVT